MQLKNYENYVDINGQYKMASVSKNWPTFLPADKCFEIVWQLFGQFCRPIYIAQYVSPALSYVRISHNMQLSIMVIVYWYTSIMVIH